MRYAGSRSSLIVAAIALVAIAAWPFLGANNAQASRRYIAPVVPDYQTRDKVVAFYERRVREHPPDQISAKLLGAQYMQRYRESLDVGDILRALNQAKRSLLLQPQNNAGANGIIASAYYALHQFPLALRYERAVATDEPGDPNAFAQIALLDMEIGRYGAALQSLKAAERIRSDASVWAASARYDELTGRLAQGEELMRRATQAADANADNSAQSRAWYHYRLGEMAFSKGNVSEAENEERLALTEFPSFELAYRALARFCWGDENWQCALDAAKRGADIIPEPETLGYESDAQKALGDTVGSERTRALIFAVERIGNTYGINDRLLSVYYSEHGVRLTDSLRIARREAAKRGDEIYAQDTLAWAAAMAGHWDEALRATLKASRFNTQDSRVLFHAGMIELHFGHDRAARSLLQQALALNPRWDPINARVARSALGVL